MSSATAPIRVLCLGGSTRPDSSSEKALRAAASAVVTAGAGAELLLGPDLVLPIFAPESLERTESAQRLIAEWRWCDGLILSSPGYHGTMSELIKNVLDYMEDLRDDDHPYLDGLPVGCIAVAYGWQAAVTTLQSLRQTVHALRGWPTPLGATVNASVRCSTTMSAPIPPYGGSSRPWPSRSWSSPGCDVRLRPT